MAATADVTGAQRFPWIAVLSASATFFLVSMDTLILNVALPTISAELGGSMSAQQWVVDGYTLAFASFLLLAGNVSDRIGARRMFSWGCALFALASVGCMLAPAMEALVAGRVALGIAAAMLLPSSMTLINESTADGAQRAQALGVWAAGGGVASAAGPILGGILTPIHWGLVFAVNVPVCALVLLGARRMGKSPRRVVPFDWLGQILALVGLACLVGGCIEGGELGFVEPLPLALLVVGAGSLAGFVFSQSHVSFPMMPLSLFASQGLRASLLTGFSFFMSWYGTVFLLCLYLQQDLGMGPFESGLVFIPSAVAAFIGNLASGRATARFGAKRVLVLGASVDFAGLAGLALCVASGDFALITALVVLVGLGGSLMMPATSSVILESAPEGQSGVASALFNAFRQVGASIGIAVFGALATAMALFSDAAAVSFAIMATCMAVSLASIVQLKG